MHCLAGASVAIVLVLMLEYVVQRECAGQTRYKEEVSFLANDYATTKR